jgi:hypothetical protein
MIEHEKPSITLSFAKSLNLSRFHGRKRGSGARIQNSGVRIQESGVRSRHENPECEEEDVKGKENKLGNTIQGPSG